MAADGQGCWHYRIRLPLTALMGRGHEAGWGMGFGTVTMDREADVIIGQRVCNPGATAQWQEWAANPQRTARLILELDDDLLHIDPANHRAYRFYDQATQDRLRRNLEVADAVFVSTTALADVVRSYNPRVYVLPNGVPSGLPDCPFTPNPGPGLIVGWAGSDSHAGDFATLPPGLFRLIDRDPRIVVHTIGPDYFTPRGVRGGKVVHDRWFEDLRDYYQHLNFDIALIPLADTPFNQSKSDIKVREMAAVGIPVIAAAAGPYPAAVQHGVTGYLARTDRDWVRYLTRLITYRSERAKMSVAGRRWARTVTIENQVELWEKALTEVTS